MGLLTLDASRGRIILPPKATIKKIIGATSSADRLGAKALLVASRLKVRKADYRLVAKSVFDQRSDQSPVSLHK